MGVESGIQFKFIQSFFLRLLLRAVAIAIDNTSQQEGVGAVHREAWDVEHV